MKVYIPQGGFPMVNTGDTRPFFIPDDSYPQLNLVRDAQIMSDNQINNRI